MSRVLVTGGCGFVGRHLVKALLKHGHHVTIVDSLEPYTGARHPHDWLPKNADVKFYHTSVQFFAKNPPQTGFEYIFHLAAMVGGRLMIENNPMAICNDLAIDAAIFQYASKHGGKVAYFSSSAAYPVNLQRKDYSVILREDLINFNAGIDMPDVAYGWAKLTGEYIARLAYEKHDVESVVYRPFSGYGSDQDLTYPFPSIIKRVVESEEDTIQVWGSGEQLRDFVHIDDVIACILMTFDKISDASPINISSGVGVSFKHLAQLATRINGKEKEVIGMSDKPEGVYARVGCTEKQKEYGFIPQVKLTDGIARAIQYFKTKQDL